MCGYLLCLMALMCRHRWLSWRHCCCCCCCCSGGAAVVAAAARDDVFGSLATFCEDKKLLEGDHKLSEGDHKSQNICDFVICDFVICDL
jgi:hypothetical protein